MSAEIYLGNDLYRALVERLVPVAGTGNPESIKAMLGPLAKPRLEILAVHLAHLESCPFRGEITEDQIKRALGEVGDMWPNSIRSHVMVAELESMQLPTRSPHQASLKSYCPGSFIALRLRGGNGAQIQ
jgi:hypothetical protein